MTSERRVVDDHEDYEGGVEDGECYEQLVEGVAHLLARQDRHRQYISGKTHCSDKRHQDSLDKEKLNGKVIEVTKPRFWWLRVNITVVCFENMEMISNSTSPIMWDLLSYLFLSQVKS